MIDELTILPGINKSGEKEQFDNITFKAGETISVVGPTGSGKTALITDIELLAQKDTATKRTIFINGKAPDEETRFNPSLKPIAMITQNTKCFADFTVVEFLKTHIRARKISGAGLIEDTIELANKFTGEKIKEEYKVTTLSGGQTRSLLIADAILIGASPIILLDEIENAGIFKQEVLNMIHNKKKIIIFVTHDPVIALNTQKRIIMRNGAITETIERNIVEEETVKILLELDESLSEIREMLRVGHIISSEQLCFNMKKGR